MSKKKEVLRGQKKHKKALKRKNKPSDNRPVFKSVEEKLSYRIKRAIKQSRTREYKTIDTDTLVSDAKEKIKEVRFIHYYLIFAKILFEGGQLTGKLNYDVKESTLMLKTISESVKNIPLLEEESVIQIELFDVGEKLSTFSEKVSRFITYLEPYQNYISNVIMKLGEQLPPLESGKQRETWEIENEVLRRQALYYIAENVYGVNMNQEGQTDE